MRNEEVNLGGSNWKKEARCSYLMRLPGLVGNRKKDIVLAV